MLRKTLRTHTLERSEQLHIINTKKHSEHHRNHIVTIKQPPRTPCQLHSNAVATWKCKNVFLILFLSVKLSPCVISESMVPGVTQKPQEGEDDGDEDEETGEKFEFDDSEDEQNTVENSAQNKESKTLHVDAEHSESTKGSTAANALYCQAMTQVTKDNQQTVNGETPAGLEDQKIPTYPHTTYPGQSAICVIILLNVCVKCSVCEIRHG